MTLRPLPFFGFFVSVLGATVAQAETPPWNTLVTAYDPALTVAVTPIASPHPYCNIDTFIPPKDPSGDMWPRGMKPTCIGGTMGYQGEASGLTRWAAPEFPQPIGNDSVGNTYLMTGVLWSGSNPGFVFIHRDRHLGPLELLVRVTLDTGPAFTETDPQTIFTATVPSLDLVHGTITFTAEGETRNSSPEPRVRESAIIKITGLPQLYDETLTFVPGGQALTLTTPALPDAFRSADSVQVWTGNVRSMPDWSRAVPLSCEAALHPAPGETFSIPDALPDPPVSEGRYYVVANVSGSDRRLGRQYVAGTFSAREPSSLPICQ